MDLGLTDRVVIVTGGSAGIGLAVATALVAEGARVVLAARDRDRLEAAADGLGRDRAEGVPADVADPDTPARLLAAARTRFGRVDGVLANTGGPAPSTPTTTDDAAWSAAFASAFLGPVRLAREVCAGLEEGGAVCFVLSTSARVPIPGLAASNGLRPGLAGHVKDLADEVGPRGIRVTGLLPGRIATARTQSLDTDPEARRRAERGIPLRRYGDPAEIGRVGAFLLSPAASYVSGCCVPVDGGALRAL